MSHRQQDGTGVPTGISLLCTPSLWRQNCSEDKLPNFHSSCALSVGFLTIYSIPLGYSCANPWPAHPLLDVINIPVSTLFLLQILKQQHNVKSQNQKLPAKKPSLGKPTAHGICIFLSTDSLASRKERRCTCTERKQAPSPWLGPLNFCW